MAESMRTTVEKVIANVKRTTTFGPKARPDRLTAMLGTPEETAEIVTYLLAMCQALEEVTLALADRLDASPSD